MPHTRDCNMTRDFSARRGVANPKSIRRRQRHKLSRLTLEPLEDRTLLFGTQIVLFDFPVIGKPIHEAIPLKALPFIKPEIIHEIADQNLHEDTLEQFEASHHFDDSEFEDGRNEINAKYQLAI